MSRARERLTIVSFLGPSGLPNKMCSRGVLVNRNSEDSVDSIVNTPSFLRVNSFVDDDKTTESTRKGKSE